METELQGFSLVTVNGQQIPVYGWQFAADYAANPSAYNDDLTDYSAYPEAVAKLLRFSYRSAVTYLDPGDSNPAHSGSRRVELVQTVNAPYHGQRDADLSAFLSAKSQAVSGLIEWLNRQITVRGGLIERDVTRYGKTLQIGQTIAQVGELVALLPGAGLVGSGLVIIGQSYGYNNSDAGSAAERRRQIEVAAGEIVTLQGYQALADAEVKTLSLPPPVANLPLWVWLAGGLGLLLAGLLLVRVIRHRSQPINPTNNLMPDTTIPGADAPLKALGPVTLYGQASPADSFEGQYYDPDNSLIPRPFRSGDPLGRSLGETANGYLGIYYVVNTMVGPYWSNQWVLLSERDKSWEWSDGVTGKADPVAPVSDEYLPYLPPVIKLPVPLPPVPGQPPATGNPGSVLTIPNPASKTPTAGSPGPSSGAGKVSVGTGSSAPASGPSGSGSVDILAWIKARPYVAYVGGAVLLLLVLLVGLSRRE